jgi:hypothetical protein
MIQWLPGVRRLFHNSEIGSEAPAEPANRLERLGLSRLGRSLALPKPEYVNGLSWRRGTAYLLSSGFSMKA